MKNVKGIHSNLERPQDKIDTTYNKKKNPVIEKTQNAYVMPLDSQRDVDMIDSSRFYEGLINYPKNKEEK
ncbi:MAG: hypothetical protein N4A64_01310 [Marinisporobacter sp.]|jgi:hypothetical protein|nr:hypothetical protein [Marinisporobacter sp.]